MKYINFRGFRPFSEEEAEKLRKSRLTKQSDEVYVSHTPDVIQEMFAPDPLTGNPSSDFYIRARADSDICNYIDKYLQSQIIDSPVSEDSQLALETAKSRFESAQVYADRLRQFLADSQ